MSVNGAKDINFNIKLDFDAKNEPVVYKDDKKHKVGNVDEIYAMLTTEGLIKSCSEVADEIITLDDIDTNDWDIYDFVVVIMGIERVYNVYIDDYVAEKFDIKKAIGILKRADILNNLGV